MQTQLDRDKCKYTATTLPEEHITGADHTHNQMTSKISKCTGNLIELLLKQSTKACIVTDLVLLCDQDIQSQSVLSKNKDVCVASCTESFRLEKSFNCKTNITKLTKRNDGMTKHPSSEAVYSAAGDDNSEDEVAIFTMIAFS